MKDFTIQFEELARVKEQLSTALTQSSHYREALREIGRKTKDRATYEMAMDALERGVDVVTACKQARKILAPAMENLLKEVEGQPQESLMPGKVADAFMGRNKEALGHSEVEPKEVTSIRGNKDRWWETSHKPKNWQTFNEPSMGDIAELLLYIDYLTTQLTTFRVERR